MAQIRKVKPRTEVKTVFKGLRMQPWLVHKVEEEVRRRQITFTQLLRDALLNYLGLKEAA